MSDPIDKTLDELETYDRIRQALDMPEDATPDEVVRSVEETLSSYWAVAGVVKSAVEKAFPAGMPEITH